LYKASKLRLKLSKLWENPFLNIFRLNMIYNLVTDTCEFCMFNEFYFTVFSFYFTLLYLL